MTIAMLHALALCLLAAGNDARGVLAELSPPDGYVRDGEIQVYPADRLWDYIDGGAEVYLDYGVVETATVSFARPGAALPAVTVDLHRMNTPKEAFGIFGRESGPGLDAPLGPGSSWQNGLMSFWHGPYYARLVSEMPRDSTLAIANALRALLPNSDDSLPMLALFPEEGRLPGRDGYAAKRYLGVSTLDDVWTADYGDSSRTYTLFLRNNRPPIRESQLGDLGRIASTPTDKSPIQMIELNDGSVLLMFYIKKCYYLAGYHGAKPHPALIQVISNWVGRLPKAP